MNGTYSIPFQSYSSPSIKSQQNKYSPSNIDEHGKDISAELLDQIQQNSINYFSKHLDSSKFRLRIPE